MTRQHTAWQAGDTVRSSRDAVPGTIPFAAEQLAIVARMAAEGRLPIARFLDVECGDGVLSAVMCGAVSVARAGHLWGTPPTLT